MSKFGENSVVTETNQIIFMSMHQYPVKKYYKIGIWRKFYHIANQQKKRLPFTQPGVFMTRGNSVLVGFLLLFNKQYSV